MTDAPAAPGAARKVDRVATDASGRRYGRPASWSRWGVRRQLMLASTLAVLASTVLGIVILAALLHRSLTTSLNDGLEAESKRIAALVQTVGPEVVAQPDQVDDGFKAQVLDSSTGVVVSTWNTKVAAPLSALRPGVGVSSSEGIAPWWALGAGSVPDVVIATGVTHAGASYVVLVGASQESQREAVTTVVKFLIIATPILIALTAIAAHALVRRALAPVEEITHRVQGITSQRLADRVPVPPADDEIATLASTMNTMLGRLESAQAAQTRFVSDASHELRSPLTTIAGALEIGRASADPGVWAELAPLMQTETTRLEHLVGDLLLLSRSDDRRLRLHLSEVDLDDLLDAETSRLRAPGRVEVRRDVHATRIVGDRDKLLHALRNLDDNAVRHAEHAVLLAVAPTADGGARIEVGDDGAGVPQAERSRIFERFVRLDESRSRDRGGSGLGLAIVAEVVAAHGGSVRVGDSDLGGASFVIELPARPPATGRPDAAASRLGYPPSAASR